MKLRDYQEETVNALIQSAMSSPGNPLAALPTGCHARGARILLYDGSVKNVEDVIVGDTLMGPDSRPRTVLALARGREEMRRIVPVKGEPFVVNKSHLLSLHRTRSGKRHYPSDAAGTLTVSVDDWQQRSDWFRHLHKLRRVPVEFREKWLDIPPYILGVFLGDGNYTQSNANLTTMDKVIADAWTCFVNDNGDRVRVSNNGSKADTYHAHHGVYRTRHRSAVSEKLDATGLRGADSATKFIPAAYKTGSAAQRLQLLAGLIDADGSADCGGYDYVTKSEQLARDIVFVARSVGLAAAATPCQKSAYVGHVGNYWRVYISGEVDRIPVKVARKRHGPRKQIKSVRVTGFTVENLPVDDFYGFTLDGDHLYLTDDFIVHHNTGKSLCIAGFVQTALSVHPGTRFVMATHVKELVEQNYEKMLALMPHAPIGIYSAGLRRRDTALPIIYGSVASMVNKIDAFGHRDFLIVDEAHMVSPRDGTNYQRLIAGLKERNPRLIVVGFSATPFRLGQGHLTEGDTGIFTNVAIDLTGVQAYNRFVDEGYLAPIVPKRTQARIDVEGVGMVGGDFNGRQLRAASDKEAITRAAIEEALQHGSDRACWLTFASGVEHAEHIAEMQRSMGINAACVHSKMTTAERDERLRDYRAGKLRSMVGYKVLTTGFDHPPIDLIIDLYATASPGMHVQKYGRGGRPYYAPGFDLSTAEGRLSAIENSAKRNCLVLDFAKNVERLGPINDPRIPKAKGKGTGEVPVRICDECGAYNHASARVCIGCGVEFTFKPKIYTEAGEAEIVRSSMPVLEYRDVSRVFYSKHVKNGGLPTLKVSYLSGLDRFNEWIALEHSGYAKKNAGNWWRQRHASDPPATVDEALQVVAQLQVPRRITVQTNLPYPRVIAHEY